MRGGGLLSLSLSLSHFISFIRSIIHSSVRHTSVVSTLLAAYSACIKQAITSTNWPSACDWVRRRLHCGDAKLLFPLDQETSVVDLVRENNLHAHTVTNLLAELAPPCETTSLVVSLSLSLPLAPPSRCVKEIHFLDCPSYVFVCACLLSSLFPLSLPFSFPSLDIRLKNTPP